MKPSVINGAELHAVTHRLKELFPAVRVKQTQLGGERPRKRTEK